MNLDHDFVQVSKLSEDQKKKNGTLPKMEHFFSPNSGEDHKKVFTKNGTLFSPNSGEDQKKKVFTTNGTLFSLIQVDTYAQMHTRVKLLGGGGMQM